MPELKILGAGQNSEISEHELRFSFDGPGDIMLLVLDEHRRASSQNSFLTAARNAECPGISFRHDGTADIVIGKLSAAIESVLCIVIDAACSSAPTCKLTGDGDQISFQLSPADLYSAVICFEIYRRSGQWKVRAVGQGYSGGLTDLLRAHHFDTLEPTVHDRPAASSPPSCVDPLERIAMIFQDAARTTAALCAATDFADARLDGAMSAAVADPATRNGPEAQHSFAVAQRSHDELIAHAEADYHRDASYLAAELVALETELPAALADWEAPSWLPPVRVPSSGIRLGTVTPQGFGALRVPFCIATPLRRPLWLDTDHAQDGNQFVAAAVLRLLATTIVPATTLDIIDVGGVLRPIWQPLAAHMTRPVVTELGDVAPRLRELAACADLAILRRRAEQSISAAGIVVVSDFGYAMSESVFEAVVVLINKAVEADISLIFTGDLNWDTTPSSPVREIAEYSIHVPTGDGATVFDTWTKNPWKFVPDSLGYERLASISSELAGYRH